MKIPSRIPASFVGSGNRCPQRESTRRKTTRPETTRRKTRRLTTLCGCWLLAIAALAGCNSDGPGKTSLFEDDHVVAAHWPEGLPDLVDKLRERAAKIKQSSDPDLRSELDDLVDWVGEVAADTNLSEDDWVPLYEASQSIAKKLDQSGGTPADEVLEDIESLCQMIERSIPLIPKDLVSLKADAR
ncbi:MAG: hypothetical protein AAF958_04490 [Planctomycetota bacterium]